MSIDILPSDTEFDFQNLKFRNTIIVPKREERDALRLGGPKRQRGPTAYPVVVSTLCVALPLLCWLVDDYSVDGCELSRKLIYLLGLSVDNDAPTVSTTEASVWQHPR